jgi:hypothetical protein
VVERGLAFSHRLNTRRAYAMRRSRWQASTTSARVGRTGGFGSARENCRTDLSKGMFPLFSDYEHSIANSPKHLGGRRSIFCGLLSDIGVHSLK